MKKETLKILVICFTIVNTVFLNQKFILSDPNLYYFGGFFCTEKFQKVDDLDR